MTFQYTFIISLNVTNSDSQLLDHNLFGCIFQKKKLFENGKADFLFGPSGKLLAQDCFYTLNKIEILIER